MYYKNNSGNDHILPTLLKLKHEKLNLEFYKTINSIKKHNLNNISSKIRFFVNSNSKSVKN